MQRNKRKIPGKCAYQADLSYVHDAGFTGYVREAIPGLLKILRQRGIKNGLVIDLGCGSGVWARALTLAGYEALGVDLSQEMLKLARKHAPKARFLRASLLDVELTSCQAVTAIGEPVNYLFDPRSSMAALAKLFRRIHRALLPGGVFVFDVATPGRSGQFGPVLKHVEGRDWALLFRTEEDRRSRILTRHMTIFRKVGRAYRRSSESHRLRLYTREQIERQLRAAGFEIQVARSYGKSLPRPGLLVFIAAKCPARP